jgi:hypothetical protein
MFDRVRRSVNRRVSRLQLAATNLPNGPCQEFYSDASFWRPERKTRSAWLQHAPFAFWLIEKRRPRTIVELGSHTGYSLLCFCQAIKKLGLDTKVYAVDTWEGDEHAGFYGEKVLGELRAYHDPRYGEFSTLIRATFDEALTHFEDGSIDLLHIDGRHFYDDVKHDFSSWRPKLSDRGIVLFHDTQVHERGFGVYKLWSEVASGAPRFEFFHEHGLGVLGCGKKLAPPVTDLLKLRADSEVANGVRTVYSRLGAAC